MGELSAPPALESAPIEELLEYHGLLLCPLPTGVWLCGMPNHIYSQSHNIHVHKEAPDCLAIGASAREAIIKAVELAQAGGGASAEASEPPSEPGG